MAVSQISAGRKNSLQWEIDGSDGAAAWDSETPDHLWLGHRDRPNEMLLRNPALMGAGRARGGGAARAATSRASATRSGRCSGRSTPTSSRAAVRARTRRTPTFAAGHDEMLVNDAIAESARDRALGRRRSGAAAVRHRAGVAGQEVSAR